MGLDLKALQLVDGQVDAPAPGVVANVADDVGQLHGLAQVVGVLDRGRLGAAKDIGRHFAHHAGHQVAIALQCCEVQKTRLVQIGLATFDHRRQVLLLNAELCGQRHQGFHHRMVGIPGKGLLHFLAPPLQFAGGDAGVAGFVNHIVDLPAKGVEGGDGSTPGRWQEEKGVVERRTARRCLGLHVLFRCHAAALRIQQARQNKTGASSTSRRGRWVSVEWSMALILSRMRSPP